MGKLSTESFTVWIFANPIAGRGLGAQVARRLAARLQNERYIVETFLKPAVELTSGELSGSAHAGIVIGGDGTLRSVADRLIKERTLPPLLPVPLGTANLMGRYLGIDWNRAAVDEHVVASVKRCRVLPLDAARVNGRLCLLMVGVGFDAHVVHELDRVRRGPIVIWDYLLPVANALRLAAPAPLRVTLDGREIFPLAPAVAFVGNLSEYATGFPILPYARPDDGLLDLCVLPCRSRADLFRLFLLAAGGEHVRAEGAVYARGMRIGIESPDDVPVQIDGDPAGHTPVNIDLLPIRLPFIVPA